MNRLETRVKRLEETGGTDVGEELFGVTRILLDQHGDEISSSFLAAPVPLLQIPTPPDPDTVDPDLPILTSYRDKPWLLTGQQFKDLLKAISGKSRTI